MTKQNNKPICVVLTGAGISADSGIDTFRGAGGLWEGYPVEEVATPEAFEQDPHKVIRFYNARRQQLKNVKPNPAHLALKELEKRYHVVIITQNIDNLHERAGSEHIIHLHGELTKLRSSVDESYIIDCDGDQSFDLTDPHGNPMRPFVVWFGEDVPAIEDAIYWVEQADILLIIGTSLVVYPAAGLLNFARPNIPTYLIDPAPTSIPNVEIIKAKAKDGVPKLVQELLENNNL